MKDKKNLEINRVELFKHLPEIFNTFSTKQKKSFAEHLTVDQLKYLIELVVNLRLKNVEVGENGIKKLRKHQKTLRKIINPKVSLRRKKKLMKGGLIGTILGTIASALIPLVIEKFSNKENE